MIGVGNGFTSHAEAIIPVVCGLWAICDLRVFTQPPLKQTFVLRGGLALTGCESVKYTHGKVG